MQTSPLSDATGDSVTSTALFYNIEMQHMVKEEVQQQEGEDVSFNLGRRAVAAETESDCNITKSPLSAASHKLLASC